MARLFVTPREVDFISDITKEIYKDVVGHKIYYYAISIEKSNVNELYDEAVEKAFETPIEIEAMVEWQPEDVSTNVFGTEEKRTLTVNLHAQDVLDRDITISEGDFFSFGEQFFEITSFKVISNVFGQIENSLGYQLTGKEARRGQFVSQTHGPTSNKYTDDNAVQDKFVQQRGFTQTTEGETADKRALQEKEVLEKPISDAPAEVSKRGDSKNKTSTFYDEY